ncbi:MAG: ParB N-terminal domain-containing protein [Thermoplasmata archaeon]|nr:ParB N-terminal domain-containing protein [Thermoplasmata archaeon]
MSPLELRADARIEALVPRTSEVDFNALRASIVERGIEQPIVVRADLTVLDGHTRLRAALLLGLPEVPIEVRGPAGHHEEVQFVIAVNLVRRHLNDAHRIELAAKLRPFEEEKARERRGRRTDLLPAQTSGPLGPEVGLEPAGRVEDILAERVGLSRKKVQRGLKALDLAEQFPEVEKEWRQLKAGRGSINGVYNRALELERIDHLRMEAAANPEYARGGTDELIITGDAWEVLESRVPAGSVSVIFTDPVYQDIDAYRCLGAFAPRKLKPGGFCFAYGSQGGLPDQIAALSENLRYWHLCVIRQPARPRRDLGRMVNEGFRPVLVFVKPGSDGAVRAREWMSDIVDSPVAVDKRWHPWQQAVEPALEWIEALTLPGDWVVDPFVGSGTTAVACRRLHRHFLGAEIDLKTAALARRRLAEEVDGAGTTPTLPEADSSGPEPA